MILDEGGLLDAIEHLVCEVTKDDGPEVAWSHSMGFQRLAAPLEIAVYRIIQEAVTNAQRHSHSEQVRVGLVQRDGRVRVEVEDWGVGFDPQRIDPSRYGLEGIRQRAHVFGGEATIDSAPGRGTRIVVELPLVEATDGGR